MGKKTALLMAAVSIFTLLAGGLSLCLGAAALTPAQLWQALAAGPANTAGYIFWFARLPRTAACLLAGAALAVSGAVIQGVLHNQLASPGIIGVNAGAGLAVTVCCAAGLLSGWIVAGASFCGAMAAVFLVVFLARRTGASRSTVILGGVAVNALLNALAQALVTVRPEISMLSTEFRMGGFSAVSHLRLIPAGIIIVISLLLVMTLSNDLDLLALGEETAMALGMRVKRMRTVFLLLAALLAGSAVSFAGLLGFVGLIVPHTVRKLAGFDNRLLLPLCALGGGGFVTACDLCCRLLFAPYELPAGVGMAVIGGPFFLWLLLREKGGKRHA